MHFYNGPLYDGVRSIHMSGAALESAIFFMMRTYLDSGLITPEETSQMLKRLQERAKEYCSRPRPSS